MDEPSECSVPGCAELDAGTGVCQAHRREPEAVWALFAEYDRQMAEAVRPQPVKIAAVSLAWQPAGGTPYGRAVLAGQAEQVALSEEGGRNQALNRAAFLVGGYVAGGELDRDLAVVTLLEAAEAAGLPLHEAKSTILSGLREGMRRPIYRS